MYIISEEHHQIENFFKIFFLNGAKVVICIFCKLNVVSYTAVLLKTELLYMDYRYQLLSHRSMKSFFISGVGSGPVGNSTSSPIEIRIGEDK